MLRAVFLILVLAACSSEEPPDTASSSTGFILDPYNSENVPRAFEEAGIPFSIKDTINGQLIVWNLSEDARVQQIKRDLFGAPPPEGRSYSFLDEEMYSRLEQDLAIKGIDSTFYSFDGPYGYFSYIYWNEEHTPEVVPIIRSYGSTHR